MDNDNYTRQITSQILDENFMEEHRIKVEAFESKCFTIKKLLGQMQDKWSSQDVGTWESLLNTIDIDYSNVLGSLVYEPEPHKTQVLETFNSVKDTFLTTPLKSLLTKIKNGSISDFNEFERKSFDSINSDYARKVPFLKDSRRGKIYEQIFQFIKFDENGKPSFGVDQQTQTKERPRFGR